MKTKLYVQMIKFDHSKEFKLNVGLNKLVDGSHIAVIDLCEREIDLEIPESINNSEKLKAIEFNIDSEIKASTAKIKVMQEKRESLLAAEV